MAVIDLNLKPTNRQLMQFGLIGFFALPLLAWTFSGRPSPATWTPNDTKIIGTFAAIGLAMGTLATLQPAWLKPAFIGLSVVTFPIGFVVGEVLMSAIYSLMFVPMALLFRLIGRDVLDRKIDRDAATYWRPKRQPKDAASYYRQS